MRRCFIFDLDDTLADNAHRMEHLRQGDWDTYFSLCPHDPLIEHVAEVAKALNSFGYAIVIITGRNDSVKKETEDWLKQHGLLVEKLYMRKKGDFRSNSVMKLEALAELRNAGYEPLMVFDDQPTSCKMWREAGVPCAQVKGNEHYEEFKQHA